MTNTTNPSHPAFYLRVIKKYWYLPLIAAILSAGVSYAASKRLIKKQYGAHAVLQVRAHGVGQDANTYSVLMTTGPVLTAAYNALPVQLQKQAKASLFQATCSPDQTTDRFVTCYTTSHNPARSAQIINDLVDTFVSGLESTQKSQLYPQLRSLQLQAKQAQASMAAVQRQIEAKAASVQQLNTQSGVTGRSLQINTRATTNLFNQYQIKSLQSQLAQAQSNLNQLNSEASIASGNVLTIVKAQQVRLSKQVATLQAQLKSRFAAAQAQTAAQSAAAAKKVALPKRADSGKDCGSECGEGQISSCPLSAFVFAGAGGAGPVGPQ